MRMDIVLTALADAQDSLRILVVFILLVLAVSRGAHLGLAAFLAAAVLAFWSGAGWSDALMVPAAAAFSLDSMLLAFALVLILGLSALMKNSGDMERAARAYSLLASSPTIALSTLPAIIGALPMPGGAGFSAPLIAALDTGDQLSPAERSAANYWFRHMIELIWPLYPSFMLIMSLSGMPMVTIIAMNLYSPLVMVLLGYFFLLRKPLRRPSENADAAQGTTATQKSLALKDFLLAFTPILIAIIGPLVLTPAVAALRSPVSASLPNLPVADIVHYLPVILGISGATVFVLSVGSVSAEENSRFKLLRQAYLSPSVYKTALMVLGIKAFAGTLQHFGVAASIARELAAIGVGSSVLIVVLPFLAGLVTGVGFGYVGVSFPIILALVPAGDATALAATVALASAAGFAGMMLSPLHVCAAVSSGYFTVPMSDTLKRVAAPVLIFLAIAIVYSSFLRLIL